MIPRIKAPKFDPDLKWTVARLKPGENLYGFTAGKVFPVWCHWAQPISKPCRFRITNGRVPCPACDKMSKIRLIGYQPIISRDEQRLVVILNHSNTVDAEDIPFAEPVKFAREKRDKSSIVPVKWSQYQEFEPLQKRIKEAGEKDVSKWLLNLWGDFVLAEHFGVPHVVPTVVEEPPATIPLTPKPRIRK